MIDWSNYAIDGAEDALWDVVVVGAGLGGGVVGLTLARQGLKVLFLEQGTATSPLGVPQRRSFWQRALRADDGPERRAAMGRWPNCIRVARRGRTRDFLPAMGAGPGGSSAIYGAALERLRRIDFESAAPQGRGPEALPDGWPFDYDAFAQWYAAAEEMMGVAGTPDPCDPDDDSRLRKPPPLSACDEYLFRTFDEAGLAPYRIHVGVEYRPGCVECQGYLCPRGCKAEGASRGLAPALAKHGARLVLNCAVERLEVAGDRIERVIAAVRGRQVAYRAKLVILAAGALASPNILRRSVSERWPKGLGNDHDLVGRGLMFHVSDFVALRATGGLSTVGPAKTLASKAFYEVDGVRYGSFQSVGGKMARGNVYQYFVEKWQRALPGAIPPPRLALMAAAAVGAKIMGDAPLFATVVEDFPYFFNRVVPDAAAPSGFVIRYEKSAELDQRVEGMRALLKRKLSPLAPWFLSGDDNLNYGHPLGTCRFGAAPETSVLTPENKVHGTENLYVVDGSFFPSSGGVNPSLTIVANALRVGKLIAEAFAEGRFSRDS